MSPCGWTRIAWAAVALVTIALLPAHAAVRIPVPDGTYCGPDNATIVVDGGADSVSIDGYTCGFPVFAADQLQSLQCRRAPDEAPQRREFDVRFLNDAFIYNGRWFRPCKR